MLRAYFDASQRNSGVFSVAGVAFGVDRAKKADSAWRAAFDGRRLHMADLHARKGEFDGISLEDADRYCRSAVAIINRFASFVVAVSCDIEEVNRLRPSGPPFDAHDIMNSHRSAYNSCLHWIMTLLGGTIGRDDQQRVQYWFELGDEFQGASRRFLADINEPHMEKLRRSYCYNSDAFVSKADAPLFDAADFVAWEWGKHVDRLRAGQHVRPSLIALMGDSCIADGKPYHRSSHRAAIHTTGEPLAKFFRKIAALIVARSVEEVDAAIKMD